MKKHISLLIIALWCGIAATAQEDLIQPRDTLEETTLLKRLKYDATTMGGGFFQTFMRPLDWEKRDYLILGGTIAGTGILFATDQQTSDYLRGQQQDVPMVIRDFGWYFGNPQVNYGMSGTIYAVGLIFDNEWARETGVLMITSASVAGFIQQATKSLTGRARPQAGLGSNHFKPFGGTSSYRSFPSGHTVLAVTSMYALSKQFKSPWIKGGLYAVGLIPPMSRLWNGAHWLSDVFLSTVMSVAVVESVHAYLKNNNKYNVEGSQPRKKNISWNLQLGPGHVGVVGVF
ncbi:MAG: phosphatase PAP2 family protein [Flavobacteriaceae bacterium]